MAQQKEINVLTFERKFNTIAKCERFLFRQRFPNGFVCPVCGHTKYYYITTRKQYECKNCGRQTSVTAGTIMHRRRTSLKKWFWAIYLCATDKGGISAKRLQKHINVSYPTAWLILHKIREAMISRDANYKLANIVEIDEAYFGVKDNNKRGRGTNKTKVLVHVSTDDKGKPQFAKMSIVDNLKSKTLTDEIKKTVVEGSKIITDNFQSYNDLENNGYLHENVDYIIKWVHIIISNAKTYIRGTYHGSCIEHLQRYLDEFCYRFNRRFWEGQLFNRLVTACVGCETITYKELTK